jgi:hypothetical protein
MITILEQSQNVLRLTFRDENDDRLIPVSGVYNIYNSSANSLLVGPTNFIPTTYYYDLPLPVVVNTIQNYNYDFEERLVSGYVNYGAGKKEPFEYRYNVKNINSLPI